MTRRKLLDELAGRIVAVQRSHPVRVAIDGVDAAGKTMLAFELAAVVAARGRSVIRASIDGFHNPASIRHRRGRSSPEGYYYDSFNYHALASELLIPLGAGGTLQFRLAVFDFRTDSEIQAEPMTADPDAVLLFDGVFLLRPELKTYWDFTIFVDADFEVTLSRALKRDLSLFGNSEKVRQQYEDRYIPGQRIYLEQCRPREEAMVVVDNNDPLNPTVER